jgi:hypothetical protein
MAVSRRFINKYLAFIALFACAIYSLSWTYELKRDSGTVANNSTTAASNSTTCGSSSNELEFANDIITSFFGFFTPNLVMIFFTLKAYSTAKAADGY